MSPDATELATAAEALVGTPFRLNGRDPASGLDCVGVLAAALAACGVRADLPGGYQLRQVSLDGWVPAPASLGFAAADAPILPGDVVMLKAGPGQFHLAIAAIDGGWVHAHAGLRRVVRSPALPAGPITHHWRAPRQA
ncbi:hypothetical protein B0I00_2863 [Novosphingobium kunmingense]|uniref:NlpC/P60 domain-containing protein n=1 Tax=Novosphingobium kunmingense TaxID=1211806 RepID=A0A2N0H5I8_9SPHN|nr:hypothetical protein [Novosphingobium kunmingense]PKB14231.1 hypothetical protein B0I00_2863 [Novosphingobium kunmingense]